MQIIARVDDELAAALKRHANESGESINSYLNRLPRSAVLNVQPATSPRQLWKAALIAKGVLVSRRPAERPSN